MYSESGHIGCALMKYALWVPHHCDREESKWVAIQKIEKAWMLRLIRSMT